MKWSRELHRVVSKLDHGLDVLHERCILDGNLCISKKCHWRFEAL